MTSIAQMRDSAQVYTAPDERQLPGTRMVFVHAPCHVEGKSVKAFGPHSPQSFLTRTTLW